jgi:hypothetical protein
MCAAEPRHGGVQRETVTERETLPEYQELVNALRLLG